MKLSSGVAPFYAVIKFSGCRVANSKVQAQEAAIREITSRLSTVRIDFTIKIKILTPVFEFKQ
jgi:hypothetical protein